MKKENNNWKFLLSEEEVFEMRKEIFKNRDSNHRVLIPKEFIEYVQGLDETLTFKSKMLILYIGIIITYRESFYTYRKKHMNLETISQLMGIRLSDKLRKYFTRSNYLCKKQFIGYSNDIPLRYNYSIVKDNNGKDRYFVNYVMASSLASEEKNREIFDFKNRQMRSIEPVRHTKGTFRKRGRGIQQLSEPLELQINDTVNSKYVSFNYATISDVISKKVNIVVLYFICLLKDKLGGKDVKEANKFRTSKTKLANMLGIHKQTFKEYHRQLKEYSNGDYQLVQKVLVNNGEIASKVYLEFKDKY